jgi:hypothetical protein
MTGARETGTLRRAFELAIDTTPEEILERIARSIRASRSAASLCLPPVRHRPLSGCPQQSWDSDRARQEVNGRPAPRFRVSRVTSRLLRPFPSIPMLRTTGQKRSQT